MEQFVLGHITLEFEYMDVIVGNMDVDADIKAITKFNICGFTTKFTKAFFWFCPKIYWYVIEILVILIYACFNYRLSSI